MFIMKSITECKLYTFVDTAYLRGRTPRDVAQQLCEGGSDIIQLRAKTSGRDEVLQMAREVVSVTRPAGVLLVINDYLDIAMEVGAEFCHLGQEDFFDAGHRRVSELPIGQSGLQIGLSSHAPLQAERAVASGAHYVAIGPIYATGTKPTARPVTLEYVRWATANVRIPWFAIGGVNLTTLDDVLSAGARRICVVSAILNSDDIAGTCRRFKERLV
jgi:thiamine-phosphate pyrophosphorylase